MTKLNIVDFRDYNSKAVIEFLYLQGETEFEIIIPRDHIAGGEDDWIVATDYVNAAYAGQQLALVADTFGYSVPSEFTKRPFQFEISITDMEKFADTFYFIIQGHDYNHTGKIFLDFQNLAMEHMVEAYDDKVESYTWGLLHLASAFFENL